MSPVPWKNLSFSLVLLSKGDRLILFCSFHFLKWESWAFCLETKERNVRVWQDIFSLKLCPWSCFIDSDSSIRPLSTISWNSLFDLLLVWSVFFSLVLIQAVQLLHLHTRWTMTSMHEVDSDLPMWQNVFTTVALLSHFVHAVIYLWISF